MTFESESTHSAPAMDSSTPVQGVGIPEQDEAQGVSNRVRFTTITWGLILLGVGVAIMTLATGYIFDTQLALIVVLAVAGITLLGGSIVRSVRR